MSKKCQKIVLFRRHLPFFSMRTPQTKTVKRKITNQLGFFLKKNQYRIRKTFSFWSTKRFRPSQTIHISMELLVKPKRTAWICSGEVVLMPKLSSLFKKRLEILHCIQVMSMFVLVYKLCSTKKVWNAFVHRFLHENSHPSKLFMKLRYNCYCYKMLHMKERSSLCDCAQKYSVFVRNNRSFLYN